MNLNQVFWHNISQIQQELNLTTGEMASLFEMSEADFKKSQAQMAFPSIICLNAFCSKIKTSQDQIFSENLDLKQVRNLYLGKVKELPSKYNYAKLSKSRIIINCLDYIELKYGKLAVQSALRELQIDPRFFDTPDNTMNIFVLMDLCALLKKLGFSTQEFVELGERSFEANKENALGIRLAGHNSVVSMFEDLCDNLSLNFDQNFEYKITF